MLLDDSRINPNVVCNQGCTALIYACQRGSPEIVGTLLKHPNIDADRANHKGVTPLAIACELGHVEIVVQLLARGVSPECRFASPIELARGRGHQQIVRLMELALEKEARGKRMLTAVTENKLDELRSVLAQGVNVNFQRPGKSCALIEAIKDGRLEILQELLGARGLDPNRMAETGATPLHLACIDSPEAVRLLLGHRDIDPNGWNRAGSTALHDACIHDRPEIVALLLSHIATDLRTEDIYGWTALQCACGEGNHAIAKSLLDHDPSQTVSDEFLDSVREAGHEDVWQLLVARRDSGNIAQ
jgi:ankyrin repeat protein